MKINSAFKTTIAVVTIIALISINEQKEREIKRLKKELDGAKSVVTILKRVTIQNIDQMDDEQVLAMMGFYNTELKFESIVRNLV